MRTADPTTMTPVERLDEIAELLARGVLRFLASRCKAISEPRNSQVRLAALGHVEAPCGSGALSPQSRKRA